MIQITTGTRDAYIVSLLKYGYHVSLAPRKVSAKKLYKYSNRGEFSKFYSVVKDPTPTKSTWNSYLDTEQALGELFMFIARESYTEKNLSMFTLYSLVEVTHEVTQQLDKDELLSMTLPAIFFYQPMGVDLWLSKKICPHAIWQYNEQHSKFIVPPDDLTVIVPDAYPSASQPGFGSELDITTFTFPNLTWSEHLVDYNMIVRIRMELSTTTTRFFVADVNDDQHQMLVLFDLHGQTCEIFDPYGRNSSNQDRLQCIANDIKPEFKVTHSVLDIQNISSSLIPENANCVSLSLCYLHLRLTNVNVDSKLIQVYMCFIFSDPIISLIYHHSWRAGHRTYREIPYKNLINRDVLNYIQSIY